MVLGVIKMYKHSTTLNFTRTVLEYISSEANALGLNNSPFVESIIMKYAFENGFCPSTTQLDNLRRSFLVNSFSNMTGKFRDQISTFNPAGQRTLIAFFYSLNLIPGFRISTRVMANLFKNDALCYFALGKIGRSQQLVNDYLKSYSLNINTIGNASAPSNEYVFFSNHQQFKIRKFYPRFADLLRQLNLPADTEVIKVHYNELQKIADAIALI